MSGKFAVNERDLDLNPRDDRAADPRPAKRPRRARYISLACSECRRRKVKCSGGDPCANCSHASSICKYTEGASRGPARRKPLPRPAEPQPPAKSLPQTQPNPARLASNLGEQELLRRILRLECEVKDIRGTSRSKSMQDDLSILTPSRSSDVTSLPDDDESDEGIQDAWHGRSRFASLASQIQALKHIVLQRTLVNDNQTTTTTTTISDDNISTGKSNPESQIARPRPYFRCVFPPPAVLDRLVDFFFTDFDVYFPSVSRREFYVHLAELLPPNSPGRSDQDPQIVEVTSIETVITASLTFMILAVADFLDTDTTYGTPPALSQYDRPIKSHVQWHRESRRMINFLMPHEAVQLDVLRWHLLEALYMLTAERLRLSSHAILTAVDLAFALELNDESSWVSCSLEERTQRRVLWWTLYLFDRRIAHRTGRGYLIHDEEISVNDFSEELAHFQNKPKPDAAAGATGDNPQMAGDTRDDVNERLYDEAWFCHLQFHVKWSQLFSKAWDRLFALRAPKAGDVEEIEKLEALVLKLKREIPPDMVWDQLTFSGIKSQMEDRRARLQVIMFTRINILRLLIRHNFLFFASRNKGSPSWNVSDLKYTVEVCRGLAPATIGAITGYMRSRRSARSFGTFATLTIVECLYHLLLPESTGNRISCGESKADLNNCIEQAKICLQDMANARLRMAMNALHVLGNVFESGNAPFWHSLGAAPIAGHSREICTSPPADEARSPVLGTNAFQRTIDAFEEQTSNDTYLPADSDDGLVRDDLFEMPQAMSLPNPDTDFFFNGAIDLSPWGIDFFA